MHDEFDIIIQNGQPNYPHSSLESEDYNKNNYNGNGGRLNSSIFVNNNYNDIYFNSNGLNWINTKGITKLCLRTDRDINGIPPSTDADYSTYAPSTIDIKNLISIINDNGKNPPKLIIKFGNPPISPYAPNVEASSIVSSSTLSVKVEDPDDNSMMVFFYDASDNSLIGVDEYVRSGDTASITWSNLEHGKTYRWYAIADDGGLQTKSNTWSFMVQQAYSPNKPDNPTPSDNLVGVSIHPILSVIVTDPNEDDLNVKFYLDGGLIGTDNAKSGEKASFQIENSLEFNTVCNWYVVVDDGEYSTKSDVWSFTTIKESDYFEISVEIIKPKEKKMYLFDRIKLPFFMNLILGHITIEAEIGVIGNISISNISFIVNDEILASFDYSPSNNLYNWEFGKRSIGIHWFEVAVYNKYGEKLASDEIKVFSLFLGF